MATKNIGRKKEMLEKFYKAKDGKIIFNALPSIGVERAVSCSHLQGNQDNGFPTKSPVIIEDESVW